MDSRKNWRWTPKSWRMTVQAAHRIYPMHSNARLCRFCPGWINHQVLQEAAWGPVPGKAQLSTEN